MVELISIRYLSDTEESVDSRFWSATGSRENLVQNESSDAKTREEYFEESVHNPPGNSTTKLSRLCCGLKGRMRSMSVSLFCNRRRALPGSNFVLGAILLIVALAMFLPLLVFYASGEDYQQNLISDESSCSAQPYTGSMCLLELHDWQRCLPERQNDSDVFIPSDVDQEMREEQAQLLFTELQLLGPSEECEREFKSFWCLLLFGVCDGSGQRRLPSRDHCIELQTDTCADVLPLPDYIMNALGFNSNPIVQDCNLPFGTILCGTEYTLRNNSSVNVTCSDQFYFDESSEMCKPECGVWTQHSLTFSSALHFSIMIGEILSILMCASVIVLSFFQHKRMFKFPSNLIIYQTIAVMTVLVVDLVHFVSLRSTVCSSRDLVESLQPDNPTLYCQFLGGMYVYAVLLVTLLWLCHTSVFFWAVMWPMKYRSFTMLNRMKYIQATVLPVCLVLPILSVVGIQLSGGYGLNIFTYYLCRSNHPDDVFYAVIMPLDVMLVIGTSLLIIIAWNIMDVKHMCKRGANHNRHSQITADFKVMVTILYYFFFSFYNISIATIVSWKSEAFEDELDRFFACEALGQRDCSKIEFDNYHNDAFLYTILYIWLAIYPSIFFVFLISFKRCKDFCKKPLQWYTSRSSAYTTSTPVRSLTHTTRSCALKSSTSLVNIAKTSSKAGLHLARSRSADNIV